MYQHYCAIVERELRHTISYQPEQMISTLTWLYLFLSPSMHILHIKML